MRIKGNAVEPIGVCGNFTELLSPFGANRSDKAEMSCTFSFAKATVGRDVFESSSIDPGVAIIVISAQLDGVLPHRYHLRRFENIAPHGSFREAKGAGHFSFIAPIRTEWRQQLREVATDPEGFNRVTFNAQLGQELTRWFTSTLTNTNY